MMYRHHEPVSLIDGVECRLCSGFDVVSRHLLANLRHAVGSNDAATHVDWLCKHYRYGVHLSSVGVESIHHFLADTVYHAAKL